MRIYPEPKKMETMSRYYECQRPMRVYLPEELHGLTGVLDLLGVYSLVAESGWDLRISISGNMKPESYRILINKEGIDLECRDYAGAVHGIVTLVQIRSAKGFLYLELEDWPDLAVRGFLLDISRNKIPTVSTVKTLVDKLTLLKYNHLEMYVEGFPIKLPGFPDLPYATPITCDEYREIERYCNERGIDLVPNVNTFGHMADWLHLPEYRVLAESESGFMMQGYPFAPQTLNPLDPESRHLVDRIVTGVASLSQSANFNINGDEPFELSQGKSAGACRERGIGNVYYDFVHQTIKKVKELGKRPLMWGDVVRSHPEIIERLDDDLVVIDWGYDADYDFNLAAERLRKRNVKFMIAPGTSSWNSFTSRFYDMYHSTINAVRTAAEYNGEGILMTDWGDFGHPQTLPFTMPGLVFAGVSGWNRKQTSMPVSRWLDTWIYENNNLSVAERVEALARYSQLEDHHVQNQTMAFSSWMYVDTDPSHPLEMKYAIWHDAVKMAAMSRDSANRIRKLAKESLHGLEKVESLLAREILFSGSLLILAVNLNMMVNHQENLLDESIHICENLIKDYPGLWLERYREGNLSSGIARLMTMQDFLHKWNQL